MKTHISLALVLALCGCSTTAHKPKQVPDLRPLPAVPANYATRPPMSNSPKKPEPMPDLPATEANREKQAIEALLAENQALAARLKSAESTTCTTSASVVRAGHPEEKIAESSHTADQPHAANPTDSPPFSCPTPPLLVPNAENLIDIASFKTAANAQNPFAVRASDSTFENKIMLQGVVLAGGKAVALVDNRAVAVGDPISHWTITSIERGAVLTTDKDTVLKLPVSEHPIRIRD